MKSVIRSSLLTIILMGCFIVGSASSSFATTGMLVSSGMSRYDSLVRGYVVDCVYSTIYGNYQVTLRGTYCPYNYRF